MKQEQTSPHSPFWPCSLLLVLPNDRVSQESPGEVEMGLQHSRPSITELKIERQLELGGSSLIMGT